MSDKNVRAVSAWEGPAPARGAPRQRPQARPAADGPEPGDVRGRGRQRPHDARLAARPRLRPPPARRPRGSPGSVALWLWFTVLFANFAEALAEGRGKAQAAALRGLRQETMARKLVDGREERVPASHAAQGRRGRRRGGRGDPRRRRGDRGHRLRRRVGGHRRVGARHPRERRRPLRGHRRHDGALRPHRGADQRRSRASRSSTG